MLLDVCLGYKSVWRVLGLFSSTPGKALSREELRQFTGLGNEPLSAALERLKKFELMDVRKVGKREYYTLNLANKWMPKILDLCKAEAEENQAMRSDVMTPVREFTRKLLEQTDSIKKVIVFGSVVKRTETKHSDIDLALVVEREDTKQELAVEGIIAGIKERFGRQIQVHYFTEDEFKQDNKICEDIKKEGRAFLP